MYEKILREFWCFLQTKHKLILATWIFLHSLKPCLNPILYFCISFKSLNSSHLPFFYQPYLQILVLTPMF